MTNITGTTQSQLCDIIRKQGFTYLLSPGSVSAAMQNLEGSNLTNNFGITLIKNIDKSDSNSINIKQYKPHLSLPKLVDFDARAYEVRMGGYTKVAVDMPGYKETLTLTYEDVACYEALQNDACSDAVIERGAELFDNFVKGRMTAKEMYMEMMIWTGALGQMQLPIHNPIAGNTSITINTGTTVMSPLVGSDIWTDTVNSDPIKNIDDMVAMYKYTGLKPKYLVMNGNTFNTLNQTDRFKAYEDKFCCDVKGFQDSYNEGVQMPRLRGLEVIIHDGFYTDDAGVQQGFIPDGQVIMIASEGPSKDAGYGLRRVDCRNYDARTSLTYGSYATTLLEDNPRRDALYHSYTGGIVITHPQAFVSLKVY